MAVREALSPLVRNSQARRCSLELCQKFGNQLLSPSGLSPNRNPGNNIWTPNSNSPTSPSNLAYRRGSADQGLESFSSTFSISGNRGRRSSLTPLPSLASGQSLLNNLPRHQNYPIIPSIHIQEAAPSRKSKRVDDGENIRGSSTKFHSTIGPYCNVNLSNGVEFDNSNERYFHPENVTSSNVHRNKQKKSKDSRLDLDEQLMKFISISHKLQLATDDVIGRGSFGTVIQGSHNGVRVAVKIINTKLPGHLESLRGERNAQIIPPHPHIVRVFNIFQVGPERALIVMELLRKGSLLVLLNDDKHPLDFQKIIIFSGQIASALQFCHQHGILHLDVKPKNVLLDINGNCKLSDFGTSKKIHNFAPNKLDGTVAYKAPELFQGCSPTEKCDVYSFGVCMWQILQRENPYKGRSDHQIIYQIVSQGLRPGKFTGSSDYSNNLIVQSNLLPEYISIYEACWLMDPKLRPDMGTVVEQLLYLLQKQSLRK